MSYREALIFFAFLLIISISCNIKEEEIEDSDLEYEPRIWGNFVVWSNLEELFLYDIRKDEKIKLGDVSGLNYAIGDNYVAWMNDYSVFLMNLNSREKQLLIKPEDFCKKEGTRCTKTSLSISRNYLVFCCENDVYLYDVASKTVKNLTENEEKSERLGSVVQGNNVCWRDITKNSIVCYDIKTGKKKSFEAEDKIWQLDIYDKIAVFSTEPKTFDGKSCVYIINIENDEIKKIDEEQADVPATPVAIYKNLIVYEKIVCEKDVQPNIYVFDISTETGKFAHQDRKYGQVNPDIWDDYIVWIKTYGLDKDVFLFNMSTGELKNISRD